MADEVERLGKEQLLRREFSQLHTKASLFLDHSIPGVVPGDTARQTVRRRLPGYLLIHMEPGAIWIVSRASNRRRPRAL